MQGREGGGLSQGPAEWVLSRKNSILYILFPQCLGHTQWYSWATLGLVLRGPYIAAIQPQTICMKSCIPNYKLSPGPKMVSMCVWKLALKKTSMTYLLLLKTMLSRIGHSHCPAWSYKGWEFIFLFCLFWGFPMMHRIPGVPYHDSWPVGQHFNARIWGFGWILWVWVVSGISRDTPSNLQGFMDDAQGTILCWGLSLCQTQAICTLWSRTESICL